MLSLPQILGALLIAGCGPQLATAVETGGHRQTRLGRGSAPTAVQPPQDNAHFADSSVLGTVGLRGGSAPTAVQPPQDNATAVETDGQRQTQLRGGSAPTARQPPQDNATAVETGGQRQTQLRGGSAPTALQLPQDNATAVETGGQRQTQLRGGSAPTARQPPQAEGVSPLVKAVPGTDGYNPSSLVEEEDLRAEDVWVPAQKSDCASSKCGALPHMNTLNGKEGWSLGTFSSNLSKRADTCFTHCRDLKFFRDQCSSNLSNGVLVAQTPSAHFERKCCVEQKCALAVEKYPAYAVVVTNIPEGKTSEYVEKIERNAGHQCMGAKRLPDGSVAMLYKNPQQAKDAVALNKKPLSRGLKRKTRSFPWIASKKVKVEAFP